MWPHIRRFVWGDSKYDWRFLESESDFMIGYINSYLERWGLRGVIDKEAAPIYLYELGEGNI